MPESLSTLVLLWYAASSQLINLFLPGSAFNVSATAVIIMAMGALLMTAYVVLFLLAGLNMIYQWTVKRGWKSSPEVIYEVCRKWNVASICLAITGIVGLLSNSQLSKLFITQIERFMPPKRSSAD